MPAKAKSAAVLAKEAADQLQLVPYLTLLKTLRMWFSQPSPYLHT